MKEIIHKKGNVDALSKILYRKNENNYGLIRLSSTL